MRKQLIAAILVVPLAAAAVAVTAQARSGATTGKVICHKTARGTFTRIVVSTTTPQQLKSRIVRTHLGHRGDAILVGGGRRACPSPSLTPPASKVRPAKLAICHATRSKTNPYRLIMVSSRAIENPQTAAGQALRAHLKHVGDIVLPGATACEKRKPKPKPKPKPAPPVRLTADLMPVTDATGSGTATVTIRVAKSELCFTLTVTGLTDVTAAHIHRASTGNVVVPLTAPTSGSSSGCVTVAKALLREIASNPGRFYVNVHTEAFPNGQIRGTLSR